MTDRATLCIPACNEGDNLESILTNVIKQSESIDEIILCVRPTDDPSDNTMEIAKAWVEKFSFIKIIEQKDKGKPSAWNQLAYNAKNEIVIFCDADTDPVYGSLDLVVKRLSSNDKIIIATGEAIPRTKKGQNPVGQLLSYSITSDFVTGMLYGFKKTELLQRLPSEMLPIDALYEDIFITMCIRRDELSIVHDANTYFFPGSIYDVVKTKARLHAAKKYLQNQYTDLWESYVKEHRCSGNNIKLLLRNLYEEPDIRKKLRGLISVALSFGTYKILYKSKYESLKNQIYESIRNDIGVDMLTSYGKV